jgi:iron only hydrogenase large subunit-like protein
MIEVAFFADILTLKEAVEFDKYVKSENDLMITSCCCPMWVGMLKKIYNNLIKYVSPSVSPMVAGGRILKKLNPRCKVVFVGPCIAKKSEAKEKDIIGSIDFVLTFAELKDIFDAVNIHPGELQGESSAEYASRGGRLYARTGGVSIAVGEAIERIFPEKYKLLKSIKASGVKECKSTLVKAQSGDIGANFIEGMGCIGGCVGGPKAIIPKDEGKNSVDQFAQNSEIKVSIDSDCMNRILDMIGIHSIDDFKDKNKIKLLERIF